MIISVLASVFFIGGPLTLYIIIKLLGQTWGSLNAKFVRSSNPDAPLAIAVGWDDESYNLAVNRIRVEFSEPIRGGRSDAFSLTFEDKSAKKRSFVVPLKFSKEQIDMLTDNGVDGKISTFKKSYATIEVETVAGDTVRCAIPKKKIREAFFGSDAMAPKDAEQMPATDLDPWVLQARHFPWRKAAEEAAAAPAAKGAGGPKAKSSEPTVVDFIVTKVWIEPGCIVCDACENEAPEVFKVLADTCIVVENAPLGNAGSIAAAAEGCPVDVIKYTKAPKPAA